MAHALNGCEVYYGVLRAIDDQSARRSIQRLRDSGLDIHRDLDEAFWMDVGRLKVNPGKLSLADCCAIALARKHSATLLTCDHHEMDALVGSGVVGLEFIR